MVVRLPTSDDHASSRRDSRGEVSSSPDGSERRSVERALYIRQTNMTDRVSQLLDAVSDEASFVAFVTALAEDWEDEREKEKRTPSSPYGPGANGWENGTIGAFLERAAAWAEDSAGGMQFYQVPTNPWRRCADILHAGKFYE